MDRPQYEANRAFYYLVKGGNVSGLEIINGYTYIVNNGGNIFRGFARRVEAISYIYTMQNGNYYLMTAGDEDQEHEYNAVEMIEL